MLFLKAGFHIVVSRRDWRIVIWTYRYISLDFLDIVAIPKFQNNDSSY